MRRMFTTGSRATLIKQGKEHVKKADLDRNLIYQEFIIHQKFLVKSELFAIIFQREQNCGKQNRDEIMFCTYFSCCQALQ